MMEEKTRQAVRASAREAADQFLDEGDGFTPNQIWCISQAIASGVVVALERLRRLEQAEKRGES